MSEVIPNQDNPSRDNRDAKSVLAAANLPLPVRDLIDKLIRKTRLWKREKAEVALELIAHFADGLEAGQSADELVAHFGDLKTTARLIRRGKKRNRPLWWRAQRRLLQLFTAIVLVYIGLAALLVMRHPNPTIDYIAEFNRPMLSTPVADRAWPIYRAAWTKAHIWDNGAVLWPDKERGMVRPGEPGWPAAAVFLREQAPLLASLREAVAKPSLGWELKAGWEAIPAEDRAAMQGPSTTPNPLSAGQSADDPLLSRALVSVMLPFLNPMRHSANLLAADMWLAASEHESDRLLADYRAMVGLANHAGQCPLLVNQFVRLGIIALADQTIMALNVSDPTLLASHRVDLLHAMTSAEQLFRLDISGEKAFYMDMIQRVYSDDGHGDGTLTLDGLRFWEQMSDTHRIRPINTPETALRILILPAATTLTASRKDLTEQLNRFYVAAQEDAARPMWMKGKTPSKVDALVNSWKPASLRPDYYLLLSILAPSLNRASTTFGQARAVHEASMVALSLEAYHDKAGQYPTDLSELVPHYLPTAPLDYSTGTPLRYKLVNGKPLLYGLGKDGIDDGGVWADKKNHWPNVPATGDWVVYPPPDPDAN